MEIDSAKRRQLIESVSASQDDAGEQALQAWRQLAVALCPLIGETGYCALFGRALRLQPPTAGAFPAPFPACPNPETVIAVLGAVYAHADSEEIRRANIVLLETYTQLLSGLIGEALTLRLLNSAWQSASDQKNTGA